MDNVRNIETLEHLCEEVLLPDTPYYNAVTAGIQALKQVGERPYNPSDDAISRRVLKNLLSDKSIPIKFEKEKRGDWHRSLGMTLGDIYTVIDNAPAVEPARPQGKWVDVCTLPIIRKCSICGNEIGNEIGFYNNFCPNCGADMREE